MKSALCVGVMVGVGVQKSYEAACGPWRAWQTVHPAETTGHSKMLPRLSLRVLPTCAPHLASPPPFHAVCAQGDSHEVSLSKGRMELSSMIDHFLIKPAQDMLEAAHR